MLKVLALLAAVAAGGLYLNFGTLEPCGIVREVVRKGEPAARLLPDVLIDAALASQYGHMTPGRCASLLLTEFGRIASTPVSERDRTPRTTTEAQKIAARGDFSDPLLFAAKEVQNASLECRELRIRGQLKSYTESAQCSNKRMFVAYQKAGYKHMELINLFAARRIEIAERLDRNKISEEEAQAETKRALADVTAMEKRLDPITR